MQVYFCDPHSPWQSGTNENTNRLVRGFFSKGTDFNLVTKEKLNWVQNALNERLRQTLGFNTPKDTFNSLLLNYYFLRLQFASAYICFCKLQTWLYLTAMI